MSAEEERLVSALTRRLGDVLTHRKRWNNMCWHILGEYLGDVARLSRMKLSKIKGMGPRRIRALQELFERHELSLGMKLSPSVEAAFLARAGRSRTEWTRTPLLLAPVTELSRGDKWGGWIKEYVEEIGARSIAELVSSTTFPCQIRYGQSKLSAIDEELRAHNLTFNMWWLDREGLQRAIRGESEPGPEVRPG